MKKLEVEFQQKYGEKIEKEIQKLVKKGHGVIRFSIGKKYEHVLNWIDLFTYKLNEAGVIGPFLQYGIRDACWCLSQKTILNDNEDKIKILILPVLTNEKFAYRIEKFDPRLHAESVNWYEEMKINLAEQKDFEVKVRYKGKPVKAIIKNITLIFGPKERNKVFDELYKDMHGEVAANGNSRQ